jgi:hypothetical protein
VHIHTHQGREAERETSGFEGYTTTEDLKDTCPSDRTGNAESNPDNTHTHQGREAEGETNEKGGESESES